MYLTRPSLSLPKPPDAVFTAAQLASYLRIEERVPQKGDETSADSNENLGTQSSQFFPLSGRSQRPLFFLVRTMWIEERELEAGALN